MEKINQLVVTQDTKPETYLSMIERHYYEEEEQNKKYKGRLIWLLPFNIVMVAATAHYCRNIHVIGKRFWAHRQKATFRNVLYVGTI
jgi:hypothetical protein